MIKVELYPSLSHCIKAVAREELNKAVCCLLSGENTVSETEEKVEILRLFLENANFEKLRVESEDLLLKGKRVKFVIYLEGSNLKCEMLVPG